MGHCCSRGRFTCKSKKDGIDQETIQSSTTPDPGYHTGSIWSLHVSLYGGLQIEGLNLLRYRKFAYRVMTSSSFVQVYTLPPTSKAAKYHNMRVYHQVQEWTKTENTLLPKDWGWSLVHNRLLPKYTNLPAASDNLLKMVKCSCKQNCDTKRCTCRKHCLDCSIGCSECRGMSCTNTSQLTKSDLTDAI